MSVMTEDDLKLTYAAVWDFVRSYAGVLEFEEALSEACLAVLEALDRYDPKRGQRSTFIHTVVTNRLRCVGRMQKRRNRREVRVPLLPAPPPEDYLDPAEQVEAQLRWQRLVASLSPEAAYICRTVLTSHEERCNKSSITQALRAQGWKRSRIEAAFRNIREALVNAGL